MILAALPIFTGAYAALVARRRPPGPGSLGSAVALAGEVVLIAGRGGSTSDATLAGDLLVLAAALCVSLGYVAGAMLPPRGLSSLATTLWGVLLGTIVVAPLLLGQLARDGLPHADATAWGAVVWLAVLTSIVGLPRLVLGARPRRHRPNRDAAVPAANLGLRSRGGDPRRERDGADRDRKRADRRRHRDRPESVGVARHRAWNRVALLAARPRAGRKHVTRCPSARGCCA